MRDFTTEIEEMNRYGFTKMSPKAFQEFVKGISLTMTHPFTFSFTRNNSEYDSTVMFVDGITFYHVTCNYRG